MTMKLRLSIAMQKGVWLGIGLMVTMIQDCRIEDKMSNHREITPLDRRYTESLHLVPTRGELLFRGVKRVRISCFD